MQIDRWQDDKGETYIRTQVVAANVQILDRKPEEPEGAEAEEEPAPAAASAESTSAKQTTKGCPVWGSLFSWLWRIVVRRFAGYRPRGFSPSRRRTFICSRGRKECVILGRQHVRIPCAACQLEGMLCPLPERSS